MLLSAGCPLGSPHVWRRWRRRTQFFADRSVDHDFFGRQTCANQFFRQRICVNWFFRGQACLNRFFRGQHLRGLGHQSWRGFVLRNGWRGTRREEQTRLTDAPGAGGKAPVTAAPGPAMFPEHVRGRRDNVVARLAINKARRIFGNCANREAEFVAKMNVPASDNAIPEATGRLEVAVGIRVFTQEYVNMAHKGRPLAAENAAESFGPKMNYGKVLQIDAGPAGRRMDTANLA